MGSREAHAATEGKVQVGAALSQVLPTGVTVLIPAGIYELYRRNSSYVLSQPDGSNFTLNQMDFSIYSASRQIKPLPSDAS